MMRLSLPLFLLLALIPASCSDPDSSGPVEIRLQNASTAIMQDVVIGFPEVTTGGGDPVEPADAESGDVDYGTIDPAAATPYRTIAKAYRYAAVTATVEGQQVEFIPADYVGEELLEPGHYTYELHYDGGPLALTLARD